MIKICRQYRSFSALRHLKTFLRSPMTQTQRDFVTILHVLKYINKKTINIALITKKSIKKKKYRQNIFEICAKS